MSNARRGYHQTKSANTAAANARAGSSLVAANAEKKPTETKWYQGGALSGCRAIRNSDTHANITANVPTMWLLNVTRNGVTSVANAPTAKTYSRAQSVRPQSSTR